MSISREEYLKLRGSDVYLSMPELKSGFSYFISARNAHVGIWIQERKSFLISRFKFDSNYLFEEYHWDVGEPYGTVKPQMEIEQAPFDINIIKQNCNEQYCDPTKSDYRKLLEYLNVLSKANTLFAKSSIEERINRK